MTDDRRQQTVPAASPLTIDRDRLGWKRHLDGIVLTVCDANAVKTTFGRGLSAGGGDRRLARLVSCFHWLVICWAFLTVAGLPAESRAEDRIEEIQLGFGQSYKPGRWCMVRVLISADNDGFRGYLVTRATDPDDVPVLYGAPGDGAGGYAIALGPGESNWFRTYARPGTLGSEIHVELWNEQKKVVASRKAFAAELTPLSPGAYAVLGIGTGALLDGAALQRSAAQGTTSRQGDLSVVFRHVAMQSELLPSRWLGYDTVDAVVLAMDDADALGRLGYPEQRALLNWVRRGGTVVVGVSRPVPELKGAPLAELLPVKITGSFRVRSLSGLEAFFNTPHRLVLDEQGLVLPRLELRHGRVLVTERGQPIVVRATYGFGTVIVLALPLTSSAVSDWQGLHDMFASLLDVHLWRGVAAGRAFRRVALDDQASLLKEWLESFSDVRVLPFQWVLFFIFLYIVLIGPVDYILVRRVLKRPELTWVTFPVMAIAVSLLAWFAAVQLKGRSYRLRTLTIVDVDHANNEARGHGFGGMFAPLAQSLDLEYEPAAPAADLDQDADPPLVIGWFGIPDEAIGGFGRSGSLPVVSRAYRYARNLSALERVPVHAWSAKLFEWSWLGSGEPVFDAELSAVAGFHLRGTLENKTALAFQVLAVVYNKRAYVLRDVPPGAVVRVEDGEPLSLSVLAAGLEHDDSILANLTELTFYRQLGDTLRETNYSLLRLDLTEFMLSENRAVVLAWAPEGKVGQLHVRAGRELTPKEDAAVLVRAVLPVAERRRGQNQSNREGESQ